MSAYQERMSRARNDMQLSQVFIEVGAADEDVVSIKALLAPLRHICPQTYDHSVRVGMLLKQIGTYMHWDARALLFSGLLHDVGKAVLPLEVVDKTQGWTAADSEIMEGHVMAGYNMIKGRFDFTADIILLHHTFQEKGYPKELPTPLHEYSPKTQALILQYARVLSIADVYDALHRANDKFGLNRTLTSDEIRNKMMEINPDKKEWIEELYRESIFL